MAPLAKMPRDGRQPPEGDSEQKRYQAGRGDRRSPPGKLRDHADEETAAHAAYGGTRNIISTGYQQVLEDGFLAFRGLLATRDVGSQT